MSDKTEQVLIRVTPETKENWRQAADDGGFRGISGFVRFAVNNEIEGRDDGANHDVDTEAVVDAVTDAVNDETAGIEQRLTAIESALTSIQDDVGSGGGGTTTDESLVIEHTPSIDIQRVRDDIDNPSNVPPEKRHERPSDAEMAEKAKTPAEIADSIGSPTPPVKRTLEQLALKSERVKTHDVDGEPRRYFVDV